MWGLFWKVGLLAQGCLGHFCPKKGSWLKSISEEWVILVNMSQDINQRWFQGIMVLGFCSAHGKGLAGLKLLASLDAYQITNYQFLQKLVIFCCLISEEFERVRKSGILWPIAWEGVIKWFVWFFKIVPLGAPRFSKDFEVEESFFFVFFFKMGLLPTVITNSFRTLVVQNSKTFSPLFIHFLLHWDLTSF